MMKKVLIIGSATVDVVINLHHLPVKSEDVHVLHQEMHLGGCAYNVTSMIRHFDLPYIPFHPIGSGTYGDFVRNAFRELLIPMPIPSPEEENGCCYCFVESDGERTFAAYHGAEYHFYPEWFDLLDTSEIGSIYICGLEIEEITGEHIVRFLEEHPEPLLYFAPGPRLRMIRPDLMKRLFCRRPILHLNDTEAMSYTKTASIEDAAKALHALSNNTVYITCGKDGCYFYDGDKGRMIHTTPVNQVDTIGAGDAHIGALIAALHSGDEPVKAVRKANYYSGIIVQHAGATLTNEEFLSAKNAFPFT